MAMAITIVKHLYNLAKDKYKGFIASLLKFFLFVISIIYGVVVRMLIFFYRIKPYRLNCKVISVGNISLGGTGKTTLVEFIARYLKENGHRLAILSRGYKRKIKKSKNQKITSQEAMGDEPYMLSHNLGDVPVIVDANRIRAAKRGIKNYSLDTVILDDGFQQWKIKKDLEVLAIDATDPVGNKHLIPRGILREPLSSLKRADIFMLTKTNLNPYDQGIKKFLSRINPAALIVESIHNPVGFYKIDAPHNLLSLDILKDKTVTLLSGIADPDSFENLVLSLDIDVGLSFRFIDHHNYTEEDLCNVIKESQNKNIDTIITTEKDAVRLAKLEQNLSLFSQLSIFVLRIELKITQNEDGFFNRLLGLYSL